MTFKWFVFCQRKYCQSSVTIENMGNESKMFRIHIYVFASHQKLTYMEKREMTKNSIVSYQ